MKTAKQIRQESWQALKGNRMMAFVLSIVFGLITSVATSMVVVEILAGGALAIGYAYAMTQLYRKGNYNLKDLFHGFTSDNFVATIGLFIKKRIFISLWSLLLVVPGIIKTFSYSMAEFIMADHPEITSKQALDASRKLMDGKKGKYFLLQLSFIGWELLSILTCGILFCWVIPWVEAAKANFYESIKEEVVIE